MDNLDKLDIAILRELQKNARKMLGEMFVENNYINNDELNQALRIQKEAA